jgi:hypothetical protein
MRTGKRILKVEIEYFELSEARAILRGIEIKGTEVNLSLQNGNARAIVTGYQLDQETELKDPYKEAKEPDRIEEINGKLCYIYKSKL